MHVGMFLHQEQASGMFQGSFRESNGQAFYNISGRRLLLSKIAPFSLHILSACTKNKRAWHAQRMYLLQHYAARFQRMACMARARQHDNNHASAHISIASPPSYVIHQSVKAALL